MRCPPYVFAFLPLLACNRSDPTKDKELAELRARVNQLEGKSSLSAASKPQPSVIPGGLPPPRVEPKSKPTGFTLDLKGQLDRINEEAMAGLVEGEDGGTPAWPEQTDYNKALGLKSNDMTQAPVENIIAFADRCSNVKEITYAHLEKNAQLYAGRPWKFGAKVIQITESGWPPVTTARVSLDYWGNHIVFVAGRFATPFVVGSVVDIVGYLAGIYTYESQAGWNIAIPAVAAYAMVKYQSIDHVRSLHNGHSSRASRARAADAAAPAPMPQACQKELDGLDEAISFLAVLGGPKSSGTENAEKEVMDWKAKLSACRGAQQKKPAL